MCDVLGWIRTIFWFSCQNRTITDAVIIARSTSVLPRKSSKVVADPTMDDGKVVNLE